MIEMIIMDAGEDRNISEVLLPQEPPTVKPASKASRFAWLSKTKARHFVYAETPVRRYALPVRQHALPGCDDNGGHAIADQGS